MSGFLDVHCILLIAGFTDDMKSSDNKKRHNLSPRTTDHSCTEKEWGARKPPVKSFLTLLLDEFCRFVREVLQSATSPFAEMVLPKLEAGVHLGGYLSLISRLVNLLLPFGLHV